MPQNFDPIISQNFNGGEVTTDPILLKPNELQRGKNIRFSLAGGFTNRPGYLALELASVSETAPIRGMYATTSEVFFISNGKIFVTLGDLSDAFQIASGLNTSAKNRFLEYNGTLYVFNGEDELRRISITTINTALTAGVSTSVDVRAGQGWKFPTSGTVTVVNTLGANNITVTARTNDTMTITAGTVMMNASIGDKIYYVQTIADSTAPRFAAGTEFQNRFLGCIPKGKVGTNYQGNLLFYSRPATGVNPDYFHDFVTSPAGYIPVGDLGDIVSIYKTKSYVIINKKKGVFIVTGYDSTTGVPNIEPLTGAYGAASPDSSCLVGDQLVTFTGKEIKQFGEQDGLNNVRPSINPQFDDKIYKILNNLDVDQSDSIAIFNSAQRLAKFWVKSNGIKFVIVYDDKIDAWSRDYNKNASCVVNYKDETFWGSDSECVIYQDEIGYDDNGNDIDYDIAIFETNAGSPRLSKYFKTLFIKGRLGENTDIRCKIYFDSQLVQEFILSADDLISPFGGTPIGRNRIGGSIIGSSEAGEIAYDFAEEKLLKKRKNVGKMYVTFETSGQGKVFEISGIQIEGSYSAKFDKLIRK